MMYANPKAILSQLAGRGSSATRLEALRLLALPDIPKQWPECPRRSRLSLLRRLACNRKKSASARLHALQELLTMATTDLKPDDMTGPPTYSPEALEMLRLLGKHDLRDVTDEDWSRYATQHGITGCEALCTEYWQWNLPDQDFPGVDFRQRGTRGASRTLGVGASNNGWSPRPS
jgi:hypothetical protein